MLFEAETSREERIKKAGRHLRAESQEQTKA